LDPAVSDVAQRQQLVKTVLQDPPPVHGPAAGPTGVWGTSEDCYEFLAQYAEPGARTLETGCGISTALFAMWGTEHTCVVYGQSEADILREWAAARDVDLSRVTFAVGPSDEVLPRLEPTELDLVLIDGSHGFPFPVIDWYYAGGRLGESGICVLDDLQLPQVRLGLLHFLVSDPRWEVVANTDKWIAFTRRSSGSLREDWDSQPFLA
jgi:hypothetical protein